MARRIEMTWQASSRRWFKKHKGRMYTVSCRQLGTPDSKEASTAAANAWWDAKLQEIETAPPDDRVARATKVSNLVRDFAGLDEGARREAVEALLGEGSFARLKSRADGMVAGVDESRPERTTTAQVDAWKAQLRAVCETGQMSEGRYDAYCRRIRPFTTFVASIDEIAEATLDGFYAHLSGRMAASEYSASTAHETLMTARQFIRWLAERRLIALPGNIDSRRFRFNHSVAGEIETFTVAEVRQLLAGCPSERTRLYLLLMLNTGAYQNDIAELRQSEVDWKRGTIRRARSKTRERGGPVVTYKLWPETLALLEKHRSTGERILVTDEGNPLVREWLEEGKYRKYDAIRSAWVRLAAKLGVAKVRLGMKHLRKTSATILGQHPQFKFFTTYFLADSPKGMAAIHYVQPNDAEFFLALGWLREQLMIAESDQPAPQGVLDQQA